MQAIRTFLARAVPWPTSGDDWWIGVHSTFTRHDGKVVLPGRAFKDFEQAARHVEWKLQQPGHNDIYLCMSGQSQAKAKTNKAGRTIWSAMRGTQLSVAFRSIWADIDVKPDAYATTDEALAAFVKFCTDVGLPSPTFLVLSGSGGFHVHWVTDDSIDHARWSSLAIALANALRIKGVKCDYGCTVDACRLLRVPDTLNWKTDPPTRVSLAHSGNVYSVTRLETALAAYAGPPQGVRRQGSPSAPQPGQSILGPAFPARAPLQNHVLKSAMPPPPLPTLAEVRAACPWLDHEFVTAGQGTREPLWREALKVAYYTREGRDAAHDLSDGHAGYTQQGTDDKYDRVMQDQQTGSYGWPQCDTIHRAGSLICNACPHLASHRSPLNFTSLVAAAVVAVTSAGNPPALPQPMAATGPVYNDLPDGYLRDPKGWVFKMIDHPEDPTLPPDRVDVAHFPIWDLRPHQPKGTTGGFTVSFRTNLNSRNSPDILLTYSDLVDDRAIHAALAPQGMVLQKGIIAHFRGFMASFIEELHSKKRDVADAENFGWSVENGQESAFVYGRMRWNCKGDTPTVSPDPLLNTEYHPSGSMQNWKDAVKLVTERERPDLDMILAVSFGGPLVCLTGHSGLVVSAYSAASGVGKSTAMQVAQGVWANPKSTLGGLNDTTNYVEDRLAKLRHLPFFYDEMRAPEHTEKFANLIFSVGQGKSKGRLGRNAQSQKVMNFNTILMAASNNSLVDYITEHTKMTTAGVYRLFEYQSSRPTFEKGLIEDERAQKMVGSLEYNYGHAGLEYAKFLGRNAAKVKEIVLGTSGEFRNEVNGSQDERFWIATMATAYCGAYIANHIGVTQIDVNRLKQFMLKEFRRMRLERGTSKVDIGQGGNVLEYVAAYINDRRQQMIITDHIWTMPYRPPANYRVVIRNDVTRLQGGLRVHVAEDDKLLRISAHDFSAWLRDRQGVPAASLMRKIAELLPSRIVHSQIGVNTTYKQAIEKIVELDLSKLPDFIDLN